jgi:hypothetical protein
MRKTTRLGIVGATVALAALTLATPAAAAPPVNDTRAGAVEVGTLPFTYAEDTTGATANGPQACGNSGSVFFRFVPATTAKVQVDTVGSSYGTALTVFSRTPDGPDVLNCTDRGIGYWAAVRFNAVAGAEYFIMAARNGRSGRNGGGDLVLNVTEVTDEPFEGSVTVDSGTVDPDTAIVTLVGSSTCTTPSRLELGVQLRQIRSDIFLARGYNEVYDLFCLPGASIQWTIEVDTSTGVIFGPGDARVRVEYAAFQYFRRAYFDATPTDAQVLTLT